MSLDSSARDYREAKATTKAKPYQEKLSLSPPNGEADLVDGMALRSSLAF